MSSATTSTASLRVVSLDKENSTDLFSSTGKNLLKSNGGLIEKKQSLKLLNETSEYNASSATSSNNSNALNLTRFQQFSTPVLNKQDISSETPLASATSKRRALGDVINTTKVNRSLAQSLIGSQQLKTPKIQPLATKLIKQQLIQEAKVSNIESPMKKLCISESNQTNQYDLEPVEICPPKPIDTFNDLFESGKISDLFITPNVKSVPKLPCIYSSNQEKSPYKQVNSLSDIEIYNMKMQKSMKKDLIKMYNQSEHREMPLPSFDELTFKIPALIDF